MKEHERSSGTARRESNPRKGAPLPRGGRRGRRSVLTPDIGLDGELVVGEALGRGPLDRELGSGVGCVGVPCH